MPKSLTMTHVIVKFDVLAVQALVTVDTDPDSERVVIVDRNTMICYGNHLVTRQFMKMRVPIKFVAGNDLVVGILDDNMVYGAKFVDGIRAEAIDPKVTTIR